MTGGASSAGRAAPKHHFKTCTQNEFQWENLYLSKWRTCTYRQKTWREAYQMRLQCDIYPLLKWVSDPEFDNWHLTKLVQLAPPAERERLVEAMIDLLRVSGCSITVFCIAVATRDFEHHVVNGLAPHVHDPMLPHAVLLQKIAGMAGAQYVRTLMIRFAEAWEAHETGNTHQVRRRRSQSAMRATEMSQRDMAVVFLRTLQRTATDLPQEIWCCTVLPQKLHNEQVLKFLEVPGFDTRLITVKGTKEYQNPRSREVTRNVLLHRLLMDLWLQPCIRSPQDWGVLAKHELATPMGRQMDSLCQALAVSLKPQETAAGIAQAMQASGGSRPPGAPPRSTSPQSPPIDSLDYDVSEALEEMLRAMCDVQPSALKPAMTGGGGAEAVGGGLPVSEAATDDSAAHLRDVLLHESEKLIDSLAHTEIHFAEELVRKTKSLALEMNPAAVHEWRGAREALRVRARRVSVATAGSDTPMSSRRASVDGRLSLGGMSSDSTVVGVRPPSTASTSMPDDPPRSRLASRSFPSLSASNRTSMHRSSSARRSTRGSTAAPGGAA